MIEQRNHYNNETHRILIYTDLAQGTEMTQIYTISSKDTVKDVIKQILARNHLSLKDPNLFYLTYRRQTSNENSHNHKQVKLKQQGFHSNLYETMEVNAPTSGVWLLNQNSKEIDITLYSDAILSRTLDLTKDNRLTLHMQTGGVLKIYDSCFSNPASIRQFHIAKTTCSEELIDLILTVTGSSDPVTDYCLVEEGANEEGRILRPKDYPLLVVQNCQSPGLLVLRRKQDTLTIGKRRLGWMTKSKTHFRRSLRDKESRTPSPVKQTLSQRLNPFPCIFKGISRSRILENLSSELLSTFDKSEFIESDSQTNQSTDNQYLGKCSRPIAIKPLPLKYMNNIDSQDKFEIFGPPNHSNNFHDLGYQNNNNNSSNNNNNNQTPSMYNRSSAFHSTSDNDNIASEWSLAPSEAHHIAKIDSTTPPLPPKALNSRGKFSNVIQHRNCDSCHPCFHEKQHVEPPKLQRQNLLISEGNKTCKPERSSSPILAFDANRICESRQSAVRFQENTNSSGIWTKENECSLNDTTSTSQVNGYKPKVYIERGQSTDSVETFTPADWDNKTISHDKVTDSTNIGTTYDNGCTDTITEYDVPADACINRKHSNPSNTHLNDSLIKQKCLDRQNNDNCLTENSSSVLNATHTSEKQLQLQRKKYQRGDRSEENKHKPDIQPQTNFYPTVNGDYDESFNQSLPTRSNSDKTRSENSYIQVNAPTNLILNAHVTNDLLKSQRMEVMQSFETITTSQSCEDFSLYKYQIMMNNNNNLQNENYNSSTSYLSVPTPFHDSDINVSSVSKENMLTLATELPKQLNDLKQFETHFNISSNKMMHNNNNNNNKMSNVIQQHPSSQIHKLFTYNIETMPNPINSQSSLELTNYENGKTIILHKSKNLKQKKKLSHTVKTNGIGILVHGCQKTNNNLTLDIDSIEYYPSLFDVLHHCDIYRVILDPNLPSLSDQLGLRLCLTKFPLDDVQRADTLQKLKNNEIFDRKGSSDSIEMMNGSKDSKLQIGLHKDGTFKPIGLEQSDMPFDVVTIESIEPDSPASFEGSLAPGHIILEVDGKDLLRPNCLKDAYGNKLSILAIAQNQLRAARQAALSGEIPPIRITAARYHDNFGLANTVSNLERANLSIRPKNGSKGRMHISTKNNTFDKQQKSNGVSCESIQEFTDFEQTHDHTHGHSFRNSDPSEIFSKCTSDVTDFSEDIIDTLKSKLIWFSCNQQDYSCQSPFDPRCTEN
ncbi:hypothetical protein MN116_002943 [Schistosoma mekongi]|uniref:PDZ domain-containing protein n=1 Tax=Schistosoma mekongi TaxID=38744 RepID=A0AAE2D6T0_SCHME|nr:hypothetical protein MN116_002943 [Schistosoma mekongi]